MTEVQTETSESGLRDGYNVVWEPLKGSQSLALTCPCNHILYEGTRGPGKTDAQLMAFRKNVGKGYGAYWRGIIFDREYKNLDDLIAKSKRWFNAFDDGAKWHAAGKDLKWTWPTGEELLFRVVKSPDDYWNYHGQEFPFIGWNELTKYPSPDLYEALMSCNRSSFLPSRHSPLKKDGTRDLLPEIPLVVFSTTNPYGAGHNWVKMRFIDCAAPGEVVKNTAEVFNPRTQQRETITKTQVRIFGSYKENIYLSPEYILELESISDPNKRKAWLYGDWDVVAGGAFDDLWNSEIHIIPRFPIPESWYVDRSFDWGSTHPFSVGWWAESNGEDVELPDGRVINIPRGSLIRIDEWYGCEKLGLNKGLKMSPSGVARGIVKREEQLLLDGWIKKLPYGGPADGQIYGKPRMDQESIAEVMESLDVHWEKADKSPGSRINGLQLVRDRLERSANGEGSGIYFMQNCAASLATLPVLPRDTNNPDDVDTEAEDHVYDDVRYRCLAAIARQAENLTVHLPS